MRRGLRRSQAQFHFSYAAKQGLESNANLRTEITAEQIEGQGVECVDVLIEAFRREVRVTLEDVDNNRAPGDDVAMLRFVIKTDEASDNVRAKSVAG